MTPIRFRRLEAGEENRLAEEVEALGRAKVVNGAHEHERG